MLNWINILLEKIWTMNILDELGIRNYLLKATRGEDSICMLHTFNFSFGSFITFVLFSFVLCGEGIFLFPLRIISGGLIVQSPVIYVFYIKRMKIPTILTSILPANLIYINHRYNLLLHIYLVSLVFTF